MSTNKSICDEKQYSPTYDKIQKRIIAYDKNCGDIVVDENEMSPAIEQLLENNGFYLRASWEHDTLKYYYYARK